MPDWSPAQYRKFADERRKPFVDLLDLVEVPPGGLARGVDLGCGPGELTALAAARLGVDRLVGIDNSPTMLAAAGEHRSEHCEFVEGDLAAWTSGHDHDLVLSSAALHWVPDHAGVLARWTAALAPGGQLAVQVPANADAVPQQLANGVASRPHFADAFGPAGPPPDPVADNVLLPEQYSTVLHSLGFEEQHVRLQVYAHVLSDSRAVVEWVKGSTLLRFQKALPADVFAQFLDEYERRVVDVLGDGEPYFYPFKRILMRATLPR